MADALLTARGLSFGRVRPLNDPIDLDLFAGRVTALLGANGRGKTTLLDTLMGVLPPLSGRIRCDARRASVPQRFPTGLALSAANVVLLGRAHAVGALSLPSRADDEKARDAMRALGIESWADLPFRSLSGGQQQLVIVARALASEAKVLFLDEPASALDLRRQGEVLALMRRLADEGRAVVFTTHDPAHAEAVADEAVVLMPQGLAKSGNAKDVLTPEVLGAALGVSLEHARTPSGQRRLVPVYPKLAPEARDA